ncbi:hypothetical protein BCh11DRAFT_03928 [Burkholderia sp. Ch1-1]|nr:hypothetical protein BCh11DRAFT_03928 [Burkholderia sp. Ch1-1]
MPTRSAKEHRDANGPSLYDRLLGHIDGEALDSHDDKTLELLSVQAKIRRILNTRAGAVKHVPDYGLLDLTDVYRSRAGMVRALGEMLSP